MTLINKSYLFTIQKQRMNVKEKHSREEPCIPGEQGLAGSETVCTGPFGRRGGHDEAARPVLIYEET